jgi:hypothetical protein
VDSIDAITPGNLVCQGYFILSLLDCTIFLL